MQCTRNVTDHVIWVGANDRRLNLFENLFPIPRGVSYNAYLIKDEKNTLMDTVDASASEQFIENVAYALNGEKLEYLVVQHMEPDHCANIQRILELYPEVKVVGNIGTPYTSAALDTTDDTVTVAEISSFQLETIKEFHPAASAITNITEDHLNRHHTMEEYIRVKECITENQTMDDLCVLNYEDEILRPFGEKLMAEKKVQVMYFSSLRALKDGIYYQDGEIRIAKNGETELLTRTADLKLLGLHNFENVMVASAMALHAGVPMETVRKVIQEFAGVEHRIEYVCEKDGVAYYNDSKGTNPDAAIKGIQAMNRPTLLIGGGYDKQSTYEEWIQAFDGKVRFLVLIGDTKEKIAKAAKSVGFNDIIMADNLKEAVQICRDKANSGDAVLLSPACASWDQFKSYEQRGELFKEYVREL